MSRHAPPCAASHCRIRNRHLPDCGGHEPGCEKPGCKTCCSGCLPRLAGDGINLCWVCTRRIAEDATRASELHDDLTLTLARQRPAGERTSGGGDRAPAVDGEVVEARSAIRVVLVDLARLIAAQRGFTVPADTVTAIAGFVAGSAEWLAAHRGAGQHARHLRDVASDPRAWRLAYPARSDRLYIGDCPLVLLGLDGSSELCGTRLYQTADQPLVHCPGCETDETIEWWQRKIAGDAGGWVDAYALAAHLSMRWRRPVDPGSVKKWGQRSTSTGVQVRHEVHIRDGEAVRVVLRDEKGRTQYDLHTAIAYARKVWGEPA